MRWPTTGGLKVIRLLKRGFSASFWILGDILFKKKKKFQLVFKYPNSLLPTCPSFAKWCCSLSHEEIWTLRPKSSNLGLAMCLALGNVTLENVTPENVTPGETWKVAVPWGLSSWCSLGNLGTTTTWLSPGYPTGWLETCSPVVPSWHGTNCHTSVGHPRLSNPSWDSTEWKNFSGDPQNF